MKEDDQLEDRPYPGPMLAILLDESYYHPIRSLLIVITEHHVSTKVFTKIQNLRKGQNIFIDLNTGAYDKSTNLINPSNTF